MASRCSELLPLQLHQVLLRRMLDMNGYEVYYGMYIYICYIFGISEYLKTLPRLQDSFHLFPIASTDLNWLFK